MRIIHYLAAVALSIAGTISPAVAAPKKNCDRCFALVEGGVLVHGRGIVQSRVDTPGRYEIDFAYPINNCALTTTVQWHAVDAGGAFAFAFTGLRSNLTAWVETVDRDLINIHSSFSIVVTC